MKVIAVQGSHTYLLLVRGNVSDRGAVARVYDSQRDRFFDELPMHSVLARGDWRQPPASLDTAAIIRKARAADTEVAGAGVGWDG